MQRASLALKFCFSFEHPLFSIKKAKSPPKATWLFGYEKTYPTPHIRVLLSFRPISSVDGKRFKILLEMSVNYLIFAKVEIPESFYWKRQIRLEFK
jgi:hypothetical protein